MSRKVVCFIGYDVCSIGYDESKKDWYIDRKRKYKSELELLKKYYREAVVPLFKALLCSCVLIVNDYIDYRRLLKWKEWKKTINYIPPFLCKFEVLVYKCDNIVSQSKSVHYHNKWYQFKIVHGDLIAFVTDKDGKMRSLTLIQSITNPDEVVVSNETQYTRHFRPNFKITNNTSEYYIAKRHN